MSQELIIKDRYRILRLLRDGSFYETYLAVDCDRPSHPQCVIKKLRLRTTNSSEFEKLAWHFKREVYILERLAFYSQQIPQPYDYFHQGEDFYLVEEFIEGETLAETVQKQGVMSESRVKALLDDILLVLGYVHNQGVIHKGINPDNLIIRSLDGKIVLTGFTTLDETTLKIGEVTGNLAQHPLFLPIEQLQNKPQFSSDIYSLGLTAIYLLIGRTYYSLAPELDTEGLSWRSYTSISSGLVRILDKAIQRDYRDRYASANKMLEDLNLSILSESIKSNPSLKEKSESRHYGSYSNVRTMSQSYSWIERTAVICAIIGANLLTKFPSTPIQGLTITLTSIPGLIIALITILAAAIFVFYFLLKNQIYFKELSFKFWSRGKYIIAYACGAAFLGNLTSSLALSIGFALLGAVYGFFSQPTSPSEQLNHTSPLTDKLIKRCEKAAALLSGGAFIGGLIGQIPGSIIGALLGATFGFLSA